MRSLVINGNDRRRRQRTCEIDLQLKIGVVNNALFINTIPSVTG